MAATIDVDVGGTFTDCFVVRDSVIGVGKSPTTHYDVTVGFIKAVEVAAQNLGIDAEELFREVRTIRYATTVSINALIQRSGPKLGLMTTSGFEDTILIGRARQWVDGLRIDAMRNLAVIRKPEPIIPRDLIVGLHERVDCFGSILQPLDREEVLDKVQYLVDKGVNGFVVSLLWSFMNPEHETMVREIIEEEYPDIYLGSVPVLLSSEIAPKSGEYPRTMTTILNAYVHRELSEILGRLGEELRDRGYRKPLLVTHSGGGCARMSRTSAVQTYNSGPVAALMGGVHLSAPLDLNRIVVTDMGGTTFDVGLVVDGKAESYESIPVIERFRNYVPTLETRSIGAGGGTIAWFNPIFQRMRLGPNSAGAMPGPACYDLGGEEPTVTDADVVLGYIDPEYFLGGRLELDPELAEKAIREKLANPLGISLEEAAYQVRRIIDATMGQEIFKEVALKGHDPRQFTIFALGGAGPTHCCGYAEPLGSPDIYVFPFSPVFGAFGSSSMPVLHVYELSSQVTLQEPYSGTFLWDMDLFNDTVEQLKEKAFRDMAGEGFTAEEIQFELDLEMRYGTQISTMEMRSPLLKVENEEDVQILVGAFEKEYEANFGAASAYPEGGVEVLVFRLKAKVDLPKYELTPYPEGGKDAGNAIKGTRRVYWEDGWRETDIYDYAGMGSGKVVPGPAILEAEFTTIVIPPGKEMSFDRYMIGVIRNSGTGGRG